MSHMLINIFILTPQISNFPCETVYGHEKSVSTANLHTKIETRDLSGKQVFHSLSSGDSSLYDCTFTAFK
jgi:hypothetical protein